MSDPKTTIPIKQSQLIGAKLYADRYEMIRSLSLRPSPIVAEVGVSIGNFSDFLIRTLMPSKFVAIDRFGMEKHPVVLAEGKGKTHLEFYKHRFAKQEIVSVEAGSSSECLNRFPDNYFDLLYIDAGHHYPDVKKDADAALKKIRKQGIIVFNDYIAYDPFHKEDYGVIQAVNELLDANPDFQVIGFAFAPSMFCDIAVQRIHSGGTSKTTAP